MDTKIISPKNLILIGIMGTLGNLISGLSIWATPFLPTISLGPYSISIALDLSHITTFISALYGGSTVGGLTGLIGGLIAAYEFGFSKGNIITGFTLPIGKALTGIAAGFVMVALKLQERRRHPIFFLSSTLISYIPEAIYTFFIFLDIFPLVFGTPTFVLYPIVITILIKASIEMIAEGMLLFVLSNNQGFTGLVKSFFIKN